MFHRWLIRGLALTLLTLCVVAWAGSYWRSVWLERSWPQHMAIGKTTCGSTYVCFEEKLGSPVAFNEGSTWTWGHYSSDPHDDISVYGYAPDPFLGFAYWHTDDYTSTWEVIIPLYFPTLLSALLLGFIWRKTKPKPSGFPVEPIADIK